MMLMWWTRSRASEIAFDNQSPRCVGDRLRRLQEVGIEARLFDIGSDFRVPTVFCIVCSDQYPYFVVGAACNEDPAAACAKALDEAVSGRVASRFSKWRAEVVSFTEFNWVQRLEHHMVLYASWRDSPAFDFLLQGDVPSISFKEFAGKPWWKRPVDMTALQRFALEREADALDILWKDMTAREAEGLGVTTKVVIPQMVPLSQDHRVRWLGTRRLLRAARLQPERNPQFNPFPHPFA